MFCSKLKDLKLSGECPFSSLARRSPESGDCEGNEGSAGDAAGLASVPQVLAPVCQESSGDALPPRQKRSRLKVNLHALGESIRKLANPEVSLTQHNIRTN